MAHIYTKDGKDYPSVTTILKLIGTNESLMKWANFMGFKHKNLKDLNEESTTFGTYLHEVLEWEVTGRNGNVPYHLNPIYQYRAQKSLEAFREKLPLDTIKYNTIFTERSLISEALGYAGTLDWYVSILGIQFLCDFKSSKQAHDTMFLQLGGYYNLLLEDGYDPDMAMIITCNDTNGCHLYPIQKDSLILYGDLFKQLANFYIEWSRFHKPQILPWDKIPGIAPNPQKTDG